MKQGVVMEVKNRKAVVLTKDGAFERVAIKKGQHVEIGSEIDIPVAKNYFNSNTQRMAISIVAVAAVLFMFFTQFSGLLTQGNLAVAAYVSLDINPSLEVGINEQLKVVEVIPINEDGKTIVDQIDESFRNQSLSDFIDHTVELAKKEGYLKENNDLLLTATMINKNAEPTIQKNLNEIKKEIESTGVAVTTLKGDKSTRKEAKDAGVSPGKYMLYKESEDTLTIEETKELSVTKIYEKLEKNKKSKEKKNGNGKQQEQKSNKNNGNSKKGNNPGQSKKVEEKENTKNISQAEDKKNRPNNKQYSNDNSSKPGKNKGPEKQNEKKQKPNKEKQNGPDQKDNKQKRNNGNDNGNNNNEI